MRSWLPPGHLAWQVPGAVGELDLSGFTAAYRADGQGRAPYDPAMMLALVLYCYFKGIRSSRKIAAACIDDVGCRVICGGAAPGHQAAAQFVRRHRAEVRRLFVQVLGLLAAAGAVEGHCAAVDGSPVSGNASRFANPGQEQLEARITARQAAIDAAAEAWLAGAGEADSAGSQQLPPQGRLAAAGAAAAAAGPAKVSATDPDSRLLPAKNGGGYLQGWNLELAAARRQVLLAIELHDNPAGYGALTTMIDAAAANCSLTGLEGRIRAWLAGNGFASAANFQAPEHLMLLVATTGEASQAGRSTGGRALPAGREKMAARLATPAGKKLHKRRAGLVEPAFAQLFARFGRYVNYRGHDAVDAEIKLPGAVRNLAKLFEYRRRHPAAAPA